MIRLAVIGGKLYVLFSAARPRPKRLKKPGPLRLAVLIMMLLQSAILGGCGTAAPGPCSAAALAGEWTQLPPIAETAGAGGPLCTISHAYALDEDGSVLEMTVTGEGTQVSRGTWSVTPGELRIEGTLGTCAVIPGERLDWGNTSYAWAGAAL